MASITDFTACRDFSTPASHFQPFEKSCRIAVHMLHWLKRQPYLSSTRVQNNWYAEGHYSRAAIITPIMTHDPNPTQAHLSEPKRLFQSRRKEIHLYIYTLTYVNTVSFITQNCHPCPYRESKHSQQTWTSYVSSLNTPITEWLLNKTRLSYFIWSAAWKSKWSLIWS